MKNIIFLLATSFMFAQANIHGQCGTYNLAAGTLTSASTEIEPFSVTGNVVDNSLGTDWKSQSSQTQWIMVNLGQDYSSICHIKLTWPSAFYFATDYKVYVSFDGAAASGQLVATVTGGDGGVDDIYPSSPVPGRYVRVEMTARAASWADHYELQEFAVFMGGTSNVCPTVSLSNPGNGSTISFGTTVNLTADAADADGNATITKVEFFDGTTKLGNDITTSPYTYQWTPALGTHTLTAKVSDGTCTITSAAVSITVTSPPAGNNWSVSGNTGINPLTQYLGTSDDNPLIIKTGSLATERMRITADGKILINQPTPPENDVNLKMAVNGGIWASKIKVTQSGWADYVFESGYKLMPLKALESFIQKNKHLPDVPSAETVIKEGLNLGDNQEILLKKIEELTLYLIAQEKRLQKQEKKVAEQAEEIRKLKSTKK